MKNVKKGLFLAIVMAVLVTILFSVPAQAVSMRHNGARIKVGDSLADVLSQFGEPKIKADLGEINDGFRRCRVELWIYEWFPWRYELKIGQGRVLSLKKIRLRKIRR